MTAMMRASAATLAALCGLIAVSRALGEFQHNGDIIDRGMTPAGATGERNKAGANHLQSTAVVRRLFVLIRELWQRIFPSQRFSRIPIIGKRVLPTCCMDLNH